MKLAEIEAGLCFPYRGQCASPPPVQLNPAAALAHWMSDRRGGCAMLHVSLQRCSALPIDDSSKGGCVEMPWRHKMFKTHKHIVAGMPHRFSRVTTHSPAFCPHHFPGSSRCLLAPVRVRIIWPVVGANCNRSASRAPPCRPPSTSKGALNTLGISACMSAARPYHYFPNTLLFSFTPHSAQLPDTSPPVLYLTRHPPSTLL